MTITYKTPERNRLALTLTDEMDTLFERLSTIMGVPKSAVAMQAICEGLPAIAERAEALQRSINQVMSKGGQGKPGQQKK